MTHNRHNRDSRRESLRIAADDSVLVRTKLERVRPSPERARKVAVAEEMLRAKESTVRRVVDTEDPRWMLAVATRDALQGDVLTFESRRRVLLLAQRVGVRPFDANLIVAIVQDRARRGEPIEAATDALTVIPRPRATSRISATAWTWGAAIFVALLADALLIGWLILR